MSDLNLIFVNTDINTDTVNIAYVIVYITI